MSKTLLIFICVVLAGAFAITCADLYGKWQEQKLVSALWEAAYNLSETNREYYQQLYNDCQNQEEPTEWWK